MTHRLVSIPMEENEFAEEKEQIFKAAKLNGYDKRFVDKIIQKHIRKKYRQNATTLQPVKEEIERISMPFFPKVTNPIKKILRAHGFHVVHKSNCTLRDLLGNLKDKIPAYEKSGVYRIPCKDCPAVYIGQTRRKFKDRLKEHRNAVVNGKTSESSVAVHTTNTQHEIDWDSAKLIKSVRKTSQLNAWESLFINTADKPLMNDDDAPIISPLFQLTQLRL